MSATEATEIKAELEKLTRHLKKNEEANEELSMIQRSQGKTLDRIEHALIGSEMNKNEGVVSELNKAKEKIAKLEDIISIHKVYFAFLGVCILATGVLSYASKYFLK
jgi:hypothetical protein